MKEHDKYKKMGEEEEELDEEEQERVTHTYDSHNPWKNNFFMESEKNESGKYESGREHFYKRYSSLRGDNEWNVKSNLFSQLHTNMYHSVGSKLRGYSARLSSINKCAVRSCRFSINRHKRTASISSAHLNWSGEEGRTKKHMSDLDQHKEIDSLYDDEEVYRTYERVHNLEMSKFLNNKKKNKKKKKNFQRSYSLLPNTNGKHFTNLSLRKSVFTKHNQLQEEGKIKTEEIPKLNVSLSNYNIKVRSRTLVDISKVGKFHKRHVHTHSNGDAMESSKSITNRNGIDHHIYNTNQNVTQDAGNRSKRNKKEGRKEKRQFSSLSYMRKYNLGDGHKVAAHLTTHVTTHDTTHATTHATTHVTTHVTTHDTTHATPESNGRKLFQVKFLCQAKSYNLKKISQVFSSKKVKHRFHDNNNILCAFLTPEKYTKYFHSVEEMYNIDNLNFQRDITCSNAEYIFFVFKNGSVVIWEMFQNYQKNDVFINKVIIFLNSYSDELWPVYILQQDMIYYYHEEGKDEDIAENEIDERDIQVVRDENEVYLNTDINSWKGSSRENRIGEVQYTEKKRDNFHPLNVSPTNGEEISSSLDSSNSLIRGGVIHLCSRSIEQKLTVSFALSQTIRLDIHEMLMDIAINTLFNISKEIAKNGKCTVSKKKISSMLDIYSSIINVNAVQDFLDIPEYFWNKVQYEHMWFEIYKYLEIPERIKILNKRYNYYKDFLKVIKTEVYNNKTFHTYRIIVLLLFIHVCALIVNDVFFAQ
ncbi:hypothetical protein, conserved [Plasmodium gonderi]|uniref:DUF155 domain-containing protein n=1 Tax=Plasmodium gonderi TaxID=77519 RepID=A0A1Y1JCD0_PLAGO|nr:hypothetical protein, conserved [Plasmodium gonderi]GAW79890.1 hypothetical protein, conserved [Plasmodium gonderi]